jgi:hypothetical protein
MKYIFLTCFFLIHASHLFSQSNYTVSGTVRDSKTGETLIGAALVIKELSSAGVITNSYGFYSLTLPEGKYTLSFRYIGYNSIDSLIDLHHSVRLDIDLSEKATSLNEVQVTADAPNKNVTSPQMSVQKLNVKELNSVPVFLGERDILKTIQLLPGIKGVVEGNSGFYVRGGGLDQNLILLDEANVYNPGHLLGFFSVFNSDAIKDVTIYKGGIPAEYGGRISSVLDIKMNDGDNKEFKTTGGIGLIASRLMFEGPIVKDKGSFIISGRRTYADLFVKLLGPPEVRSSQLYFYDLNAKANYQLGTRDKIFLSGYFGRDNFSFNNTTNSNRNFGIDFGNATLTLRENHLFSDKLFLNSSLIFSNYSNNITLGAGDAQFQVTTGIRDFSVKENFEYFISAKNTLKFGFESTYHTFRPGEVTINSASATIRPSVLNKTIERKHALENGIYVSDDFSLGKKINMSLGVRYSLFTDLGAGTVYNYDAEGNPLDSTIYSTLQPIKTYSGIEPRFSVAYVLNEVNSVKISYNHIDQYLHLLSNATAETPVDLWIPSSPMVKPQIGDQAALGYFRNFRQNVYESSVEVYYKNMANQIDYKPGADLRFNKTVESQLLFGKGWAYGVEFFLKKKYGKLNGWIGYTYSRTLRKFDGIDDGATFPAKQDEIHDVSIVGIYELSKKWIFSSTWVYNTGNAITWPSGKYQIDGMVVNLYTQRNGYRMPPYHRLDLGVTWNVKKTRKIESSWNFSVYNVYARENAFSISFEPDPNDPTKTRAVQLSLFRFVPAFTYNFKF